MDAAKFPEIAGTIAGDDTVLIITPNKKQRESLQQKVESFVGRPLAAALHKMKDLRNIAVVGVSGYTGFELARILLRHPEAQSLAFSCAIRKARIASRSSFLHSRPEPGARA
jgi:hypothetical protein